MTTSRSARTSRRQVIFEIDALFREVSGNYLALTMDKAWFKAQLRRAGITSGDLADAIGRDRAVVSRILNGHQRPTFEQAQAFAEQLGTDISTVLEKTGLAEPQIAQQIAPGFAESDATPWLAPARQDDPSRIIAAALGADRPGVDVWRVKGLGMSLAGYLPGDMILVDTHSSERVRAGDVVIAQHYQPNGTAITLLRLYEPPVLVSASADPSDRRVLVVDGVNVVIRGKVISSWRN